MKNGKQSAGILLYRVNGGELQFFLVHPGGPFWAKKDAGAWSIPKGEFTNEAPLAAAKREFEEETGIALPLAEEVFKPLSPVTLTSGKVIYAWAAEGNADAQTIKSNVFEMEWPPKSGRLISAPEVDKAGWFNYADAIIRINKAQASFIEEAAANTKPIL